MRLISMVCGVTFLLCLLAMSVLSYAGGRAGEPLVVPPLLPAEIVPMGLAFLAGVLLVSTLLCSLVARRQRRWTAGVTGIVVAASIVYWLGAPYLPGYLHGLRDRFVSQVGYDRMREFAEEVSRRSDLQSTDGVLVNPNHVAAPSPDRIGLWDELASRYPFLRWNHGYGTVIARQGLVELTWGSPLTGHWGFQVAIQGEVGDVDPGRARILRVARDIQFVYYFD